MPSIESTRTSYFVHYYFIKSTVEILQHPAISHQYYPLLPLKTERCHKRLRRLQLLGRSNTTAGVCCLRPCVRRAAPPSLAEKRVLRVLLQRVIQKELPVLVCTSRGSTHRVLTNVSARVLLLCRSYIKRLAVNIQLIFTAQTKTKTNKIVLQFVPLLQWRGGLKKPFQSWYPRSPPLFNVFHRRAFWRARVDYPYRYPICPCKIN